MKSFSMNFFARAGHIKAAEFVDLLDGSRLKPAKMRHLEVCGRCRATFRSLLPAFETLNDSSRPEPGLEGRTPDWSELRSSVRSQLLARAVRRSSLPARWTGQSLTPAAAWGLSLALLAGLAALGSVWHYQTNHEPASVAARIPAADAGEPWFIDDRVALEAEAVAWSPETEIFIAINELEDSEEELLRELIAVTLAELEADDGV